MTLKFVPQKVFNNLLKKEIQPEVKSELLSNLCRLNILYMINRSGSGHIGSSFSSIDLMSWIFLEYVSNKKSGLNYFFSSKGHDAPALYSVMASLGLIDFKLIHQLRKIEGLPGHPDINTPNVITNTGSLGMGVSKAKGLIKANRLNKTTCKVFVMTGDGELQEGQFWESILRVKQEQMSELIIIIDNNKFQSDRSVKSTSDLGKLEDKINSFGIETLHANGNNIYDFSKSLTRLINNNNPSALIANTTKGNGVSYLDASNLKEGEFYRYHSGSINNDLYKKCMNELLSRIKQILNNHSISLELKLTNFTDSEPIAPTINNQQSLIKEYTNALLDETRNNDKIVALDGDLILDTGLIPFEKEFPDRFFECGIAEQDMVSQAGTLALQGFIPIVHSFASFLSARPNEQIYNNATENTKIIYIGSLAGILPGGPGHSHQAVRDISSLSGIPNLKLIQPSCEQEVSLTLKYCINNLKYSSYIRLCSIPIEIPFSLPKEYNVREGKGVTIAEGKDVIVFGYGPVLLTELYKARSQLLKFGIKIKVVNLPWLNYVNSEWLKEQIKGFNFLFTIDDHYLNGGQGEMLLSKISEQIDKSDFPKIFSRIGVDEIPRCGTNQEVLKYHNLDALSISNRIKKTISDFNNSF